VAQPDFAPAYRFSAERENDELVGNEPLNPAASCKQWDGRPHL
jgi:hypothetical protein